MKKLILMRHGKSSWKNPDLDDYDRPLKKRGKQDSPFMAEFLKEKDIIPQKIFSSTALRTRQTTELINSIFKLDDSKIEFLESFYLSLPKTILDFLIRLDNSLDQVMIIGHNPTMEMLIENLTGEIHKFPTAAVAIIDLQISEWKELNSALNCGKLKHLLKSKKLRKKE